MLGLPSLEENQRSNENPLNNTGTSERLFANLRIMKGNSIICIHLIYKQNIFLLFRFC
jgi:hypothetical protein